MLTTSQVAIPVNYAVTYLLMHLGHHVLSNVLLVLNVSLDNGEGRPAHGRDEMAVQSVGRRDFNQGNSCRSKREDWPLIALTRDASQLRIDIKQNVNVVGHDLALKQETVRLLANLSDNLLELSTPATRTGRRYFGQKTTWYLHEKATFRFDR
jgi:hypothetical protein